MCSLVTLARGVGSSEMVVRLRMIEHFLLNDLDFHCRMHYAPRDSKSHPVERVMASLNEALGDGRFVNPSVKTLSETYTEKSLFQMTTEEVHAAAEKLNEKAAIECAQKIASRYQSTPCMKTTIHAQAYNPQDIYSSFWYDEADILAWHQCAAGKKASIPGSTYYQYLCDQFTKHYIRYYNGVEGIRIHGEFRCPGGITRVPPPGPDLSTTKADGTWSYHTEKALPSQYRCA